MTVALRSRRAGPVAALIAAALAALLLVGCGGDDEEAGGEAAAAVRAAPDKTVDAGSARVALNVTLAPAGTSTTTVTGDGVFDLRNRRGILNLDLGSLGPGGPVETVLDSNGIYVKLPEGILPGSRPWYRFDLAALSRQGGLGSLAQLQQSDPTQVLAYLRGATGDMREVGAEDVRGTSTTHYRGEVDLRRAAESLSPEGKRAVEQAIESMGTSSIPTDVWLDDEGRIRKTRLTVDPDGSGRAGPGTVDVELYEFGVDTDIQVPPADQVTDLTSLIPKPPG